MAQQLSVKMTSFLLFKLWIFLLPVWISALPFEQFPHGDDVPREQAETRSIRSSRPARPDPLKDVNSLKARLYNDDILSIRQPHPYEKRNDSLSQTAFDANGTLNSSSYDPDVYPFSKKIWILRDQDVYILVRSPGCVTQHVFPLQLTLRG